MGSIDDTKKREILVMIDEINDAERRLLGDGIDASDYSERAEALDIVRRIERKMGVGDKITEDGIRRRAAFGAEQEAQSYEDLVR